MGDNKQTENITEEQDNEAFAEVLMTIRSRKPKKQDTEILESRASKKSDKSEKRRKKRESKENSTVSKETIPLTKEEEEKQAQERLDEIRITNKIRERLKARREKKREERLHQMDALGIKSRDNSNNSRSTISTESSESAAERRQIRARKRSLLPLSVVVEQLRHFMSSEESLQKDFLETIKVLRGKSEADEHEEEPPGEEPPDEIEDSIHSQTVSPLPEVDESEALMEEQEEVENKVEDEGEHTVAEEPVNTEGTVVKKKRKRRITCKIDSRWPKGHKLYTKPVDERKRTLSSLRNVYFLSNYLYVKSLHSRISAKDLQSNHNIKGQELLDYERWREEMMKIAYDDEFAKGKDKMFVYVPLPEISSTSTTQPPSSRRIASYRDKVSLGRMSKNDRNTSLSQNSDQRNKNYKESYLSNQSDQISPTTKTCDSDTMRERASNLGIYDTRKYKTMSKRSNVPPAGQHKQLPVEKVNFQFKSNGEKLESNVETRSEDVQNVNSKDKTKQERRESRESTDSAINEPSTHSNESSNNTPDVATPTVHNLDGKKVISNFNQSKSNGSLVHASKPKDTEMQRILIENPDEADDSMIRLLKDLQDHVKHHPGHIQVVIEPSSRDSVDWIVNSIKTSFV